MILSNNITESTLLKIKSLYMISFPNDERKPFDLIIQKYNEGVSEIFAIQDENNNFFGLVITILYKDLVLLDYFAICENARGNGIGSQIIKEMQERCNKQNKRLFLEIESTKSTNTINLEEKQRRKNFYLKNNMVSMDYLVNLFGVEMEIMAYNCNILFDEYHEIFEKLFSKSISEKIKLIR